jgi:hypothetical protein
MATPSRVDRNLKEQITTVYGRVLQAFIAFMALGIPSFYYMLIAVADAELYMKVLMTIAVLAYQVFYLNEYAKDVIKADRRRRKERRQ